MRRRGGLRLRPLRAALAVSALSLVVTGLAAAGTPLSFPNLATLHAKVDAAPAQWKAGYAGREIGIAFIDTGVADVADFDGRLVQLPFAPSLDDLLTGGDAHGHGTFVAALAAGQSSSGRYIGIAPHARVFALDVADRNGLASTRDILLAFEWVLANHERHNIRVVNTSFVETTPSSYRQSYVGSAVERLWRAGIVVVASAGNLGSDPGAVDYAPANDPFVITVGATDLRDTQSTGDDVMASFSSRGRTRDGFAKPDILAPGRRVVSRLPGGSVLAGETPAANAVEPGYVRMSGTSFAAPQVAAAAAALLEQHPDWTPDEVKWALVNRARKVYGSSVKALALDQLVSFTGTPKAANTGVEPSYNGLAGTSIGATWSSNSWTSNSWTSNSWTSNSWTSNSWD